MALINCPECSAEISDKSISCVKCGYPIAPPITPIPVNPNKTEKIPANAYLIEPQKNPGLAAVLSLVVPGLGQIYNGEIGIGLFMMALTIGLYFIVIGFFVHIWLIFDAYNYAEKLNQKLRSRNIPLDVDFDPQNDNKNVFEGSKDKYCGICTHYKYHSIGGYKCDIHGRKILIHQLCDQWESVEEDLKR